MGRMGRGGFDRNYRGGFMVQKGVPGSGRMGARECLRSETTKSLTRGGGQGAWTRRALYTARRVTELHKGLGVTVQRRREAPPRFF